MAGGVTASMGFQTSRLDVTASASGLMLWRAQAVACHPMRGNEFQVWSYMDVNTLILCPMGGGEVATFCKFYRIKYVKNMTDLQVTWINLPLFTATFCRTANCSTKARF